MTKEKDYYWTITKDEFLERLKTLKTPYHLSVWNYLQAYIIRGRTEIPLWKVCYNLYEAIGLLATNISIDRMSENLNISTGKIKGVLKDLDDSDYIIKYVSRKLTKKNEKESINNTNIYIIGFINSGENKNNVYHQENYFVSRINNMRQDDRKHIIKLFDRQLRTAAMIKEMTKELKEIQDYLFRE